MGLAKKFMFSIASFCLVFSTAFAKDDKSTNNINKAIKIINLYDLEQQASKKLPAGPYGYISGGAEDQITLKDNTKAFNKKRILPRVLSNIGEVSLKTKFLGIDIESPIILAPMAAHGLVHAQGEKATAVGVAEANTLASYSTYSSELYEDIAKASNNRPFLFQLYTSNDPAFNEFLINKAKEAGAIAVVMTVDAGVAGNREADKRNNYKYNVAASNVSAYYAGKTVTQAEARKSRKISFSPEDIAEIKKISALPVFVKGIQHPADAEIAIKAGADGIWVSNHGGRQLDGAPASFDMLPEIAKVTKKRVPIVFDSGVRRGTHVFKALASGADIVAIGRPAIYGLALGGAEGVKSVFEQLNYELKTTMQLAGTENIEKVKETELWDVE